ncbi:PhoH family protein [Serpentinicella alkaliphila]|uniref:PhoH-like protein n=1 Tax=Serpentinicella alkaliphila TaxID=1734049 RepID=A0A4R2TY07_9FIRM|nr:PhoH family protein [Serpentinicella alkaliphila]QUH26903.1 PhoH family protein [Serpentinicella alkaliphila]TCQ08136.1 phosphate starvation-inducible PhoH-like protein [Serpentinicella alkaliphila]
MSEKQLRLPVEDEIFIRELFGDFDSNKKVIESTLNINIVLREDELVLIGEEKSLSIARCLINELFKIRKEGESLNSQKISYVMNLVLEGNNSEINKLLGEAILINHKGKPIKPKTIGQKSYISVIEKKDLAFGIGPAGTGKTYLAVAMAVKALKEQRINRIVLTRPAVEAGESLGFLPGDLKDKVDPYLRPLYDSLFDLLGQEKYLKYMERGVIEVAPLAYMRGRTLNNSFVILDEAQNTTKEQMKMFVTRLGIGSKAVITGDITQIDLPRGKFSGLKNAIQVLSDIEEIGFCYLSDKDVVRHQLVQKIIKAYDKFEKEKN